MRNPHGYTTIIGDLARKDPKLVEQGYLHTEAEIDTFTCVHCCRVVHVPARADPSIMGGFCRQCMALICPKCVAKGTCTPWEKKMLEMEARHRFREAAGLYEY